MKNSNLLFLFIFLIILPVVAQAVTPLGPYRSPQGYSFLPPAGWIATDPKNQMCLAQSFCLLLQPNDTEAIYVAPQTEAQIQKVAVDKNAILPRGLISTFFLVRDPGTVNLEDMKNKTVEAFKGTVEAGVFKSTKFLSATPLKVGGKEALSVENLLEISFARYWIQTTFVKSAKGALMFNCVLPVEDKERLVGGCTQAVGSIVFP